MANITTITNISNQSIPILVNSIGYASVNVNSDLKPEVTNQTFVTPGAQLSLETVRLDEAQLQQLSKLKLITFVSR